MSDVYQAPQSELTEAIGSSEYGSIEKGINGDYPFSIGDVLNEAWARTNGAKFKLNWACGLYFLVYLAVYLVSTFIIGALALGGGDLASIAFGSLISGVLVAAVSTPPLVGVMVLGLNRSMDQPINPTAIFQHYQYIVPLLIAMVLMYIFLAIGFLLLIIPGIYLAVAYSFTLMLIVDKGLSPWQALETSRKAITKRWFTFFVYMLLIGLINLIASIPLLIGLIWTVPMSIIAFGIIYRNMFGFGPESPSETANG